MGSIFCIQGIQKCYSVDTFETDDEEAYEYDSTIPSKPPSYKTYRLNTPSPQPFNDTLM